MIALELTGRERRAYREALAHSKRVRQHIEVLDHNEDPIGSITDHSHVLSGQVDVDVTQAPTRKLTLVLSDPDRRLHFDPHSPSEAGVFARQFLAARRGVYVDELQDWVDVPVFHGPITNVAYDPGTVTITAEGKEALLLDPARSSKYHTWRKGTRTTSVMRDIFDEFGEQRLRLPELDHRLPHHHSFTRHETPWHVLQHLAASMNRHLYYDNEGYAKLRHHPDHPAVVFHDGHGGKLYTVPKVTYARRFFNAVEALGPPAHVQGTTTPQGGAGGANLAGPMYANPVRSVAGLTAGRIDQGVDYSTSADSPIYAVGNGTVVVYDTSSSWPGGKYIAYRLTDGPAKGKVIYLAENLTLAGGLSVGSGVGSGTVIATLHPGYPNCETGWADSTGGHPLAQDFGGYTEGDLTALGLDFSQFLVALGAPAGLPQGRKVSGWLPLGWDGPPGPGSHFTGTPIPIQDDAATAITALGLARDPWTVGLEIISRYESGNDPTLAQPWGQPSLTGQSPGQYRAAKAARPDLIGSIDYTDPVQAYIVAALYIDSRLGGYGGYGGMGNLLRSDRGVARVYRQAREHPSFTDTQLAPYYYAGGGY